MARDQPPLPRTTTALQGSAGSTQSLHFCISPPRCSSWLEPSCDPTCPSPRRQQLRMHPGLLNEARGDETSQWRCDGCVQAGSHG